ncbi:LutC/YkgG family protein [Numidum massiliense]|uniref:LutC/YkgG family protein n=1 Tax=Numidum massiliense TaxID=1522315 RepID=UPI0009E97574|nr:lactate utilization protein C [Numidum massiliense]
MTVHNREPFLDHIAHRLGRPRRRAGAIQPSFDTAQPSTGAEHPIEGTAPPGVERPLEGAARPLSSTERLIKGAESSLSSFQRPTWSVRPQWDVFDGLTVDELVDVLEAQCAAIHTAFKRTARADLPRALQETIDGYAGKSIVAARDARNEAYGLTDFYNGLQSEGHNVHIWDASLGKQNQVIAERADIGITFSDMTLAESGTVTLFTGKDHGRSISLLPKAYIAIIPKQTIVPRMTQATKALHDAEQRGEDISSCVCFISGPSNSADIEMKLIVGVHGPIHATYIVVDD